jgi:hypothetical protein
MREIARRYVCQRIKALWLDVESNRTTTAVDKLKGMGLL